MFILLPIKTVTGTKPTTFLLEYGSKKKLYPIYLYLHEFIQLNSSKFVHGLLFFFFLKPSWQVNSMWFPIHQDLDSLPANMHVWL